MPKKLSKSALLAALLLVPGIGILSFRAAGAQKPIPPDQTQAGMNETAGKDLNTADTAMNRAYKILLLSLDSKPRAKLRLSQRQWLKFRDAEPEFLSMKVEGGSVYPMVSAGNKARLTRERTKELNDAYTNFHTEGMM